jgi:hypothetical protein
MNLATGSYILVFLTAFSLLMHEILLARLYIFFLGEIAAFMAIPVTMLGLSLGALQTHRKICLDVSKPSIGSLLIKMTLSTLLGYIAAFELFNQFFGLINFTEQNPLQDALRVVTFSLIFVPSIAYCGQILANFFEVHSDSMNRLYAADLSGSAFACLLTIPALRIFGMSLTIVSLITLMLVTASLYFAIRTSISRRYSLGVPALFIAALVSLGTSGLIFYEKIDPSQIRSPWESVPPRRVVSSHWDDISRVSLLEYESHYKIIHNGNASNVMIERFPVALPHHEPNFLNYYRLPFELGRPIDSVLVLFAGAGRDMVLLDEFAKQPISITGVEISSALKDMVTQSPEDKFGLGAFFAKDNIHYLVGEARTTMATDPSTYNLIFVASRGAQDFSRFGHSRRYLDTAEAFDLIFDRLKTDGMVIFHYSQFERDKLEMVKRIFSHRHYAPIANSSLRISLNPSPSATDTWLFKPKGFSSDEMDRLHGFVRQNPALKLHYAPYLSDQSQVAREIQSPLDLALDVPTDDRPYPPQSTILEILAESFRTASSSTESQTSFSEDQIWEKIRHISVWTRIFSLVLFVLISVLVIVAFYFTRNGQASLPRNLTAYFVSTGIAYIAMQFCFMSRAELLLGTPMMAISVVLFAFLLFNAVGSYLTSSLAERIGIDRSTRWAICLAAFCAAGGYGLISSNWINQASTLARVFGIVSAIAPFCIFSGMLYPLGVMRLNDQAARQLIPMSFGISTISSVLGGCVVLAFSIDFGFKAMLIGTIAIYGVTVLSTLAKGFSTSLR